MEFALYSIWQVDIKSLVKNKLFISKEYHVQPSEIDRMVYFEYEYILEFINAEQKEIEKKNKEDEKKYGNLSKPHLPNYGNMSLPKVNIPKF